MILPALTMSEARLTGRPRPTFGFVWRSNSRLILQPVMAEENRRGFVISVVCWKLRVRYFIFPPIHPEGGLSKSCCTVIPPTQPNLFSLMPVLVEKMDARR
jgi:hypothetical protein